MARWKSATTWVARAVVHTIGVCFVFSIGFRLSSSPAVVQAFGESWGYGLFEQAWRDFAIQLLLSIAIWTLLMLGLALIRANLRPEEPKRVILKARGSAMTETLIITPILLMLTLGLLQLTLNSTTAILTSLAAFQAGRVVYLWDGEDATWGRNGGISKTEVEERARVAAATVLAPAQPSNYRAEECDASTLFDTKLEAMMSVTLGMAGSFGVTSAAGVKALVAGKRIAFNDNMSVDQSFDTDSFELRGPVKMYMAYCNTTASYQESSGYNITTVRYDYLQSLPLVGYLFGTRKATGWYAPVTRSFRMVQQIHPNPTPPTSIFAFLSWNPFGDAGWL